MFAHLLSLIEVRDLKFLVSNPGPIRFRFQLFFVIKGLSLRLLKLLWVSADFVQALPNFSFGRIVLKK